MKDFLIPFFLLIMTETFAQNSLRWHHLDPERDSVYGISTDRAYELLKGRKKKTVIVAVIDSGIDTLHEDLKDILWRNPKEKGHDEDRDGYTNDRYGWNFMGDVPKRTSYESQRVYFSLKEKCAGSSPVGECSTWLAARDEFRRDSTQLLLPSLEAWSRIEYEDSVLRRRLNKESYVVSSIGKAEKDLGLTMMAVFLAQDSTLTNQQLLARITDSRSKLLRRFSENPLSLRAQVPGDDYYDFNDKFYGNSNVFAAGDHGTHVSGIIGATRNNVIGVDGIADNVRIISLKTVPWEGDEYDKDVALSIRYAVDHGAKVINMSLAKNFSPEQQWVEEAILYAAMKDVLLIHAAGNDMANNDSIPLYPTPKLLKGGYAPNIISVGASGPNRSELIAPFSNYGKQMVDVFAPGVDIYSTTITRKDGTKYVLKSGTSMAGPVVAGLAALVRSYFPGLSAVQVKQVIESSVTKIDGNVTQPKTKKQVPMTELCRTGGVVNAYETVKLATKLR